MRSAALRNRPSPYGRYNHRRSMGRTSILLQINSKSSAITLGLSESSPVYFQTISTQLRRSVQASALPSNAVSFPQATDQLPVAVDLPPGAQPYVWEPRAP